MNDDELPMSYEEWRKYITIRCNIELTLSYLTERLAELQDGNHAKTRAFASRYGVDHLQQTIKWFRRAADEMVRSRN